MSTLALPGFAEGDPVAELWDRHCRSRQPESKATCAVLEAVADILQQEGIAPSPTAVFAATMSSLERADASMPAEQTGAMLTVLATALDIADIREPEKTADSAKHLPTASMSWDASR